MPTYTFPNDSAALVESHTKRLKGILERNAEADFRVVEAAQSLHHQSGAYVRALEREIQRYDQTTRMTQQDYESFYTMNFHIRFDSFIQSVHKRSYTVYYTYG